MRLAASWYRRVFQGLLGALMVVLPGAAWVGGASDAIAQSSSRRAWLGVELEVGSAGGVIAKHVVTNSPAGKAGIADGDQIVSVDGTALDEPKQLVARVALVGPGNPIQLRIRHGGKERDVSPMLMPFPGADQILRLDKVGTLAPNWKPLSPVVGTVPPNIGAMRGKVVLLGFWASWCAACRMLSPHLSKLQTAYSAQGLNIVGLTSDDVAVASKASQALSIQYAVASDTGEATAALYGVRALPVLFAIDKKGVIREVFLGYEPSRPAELEKFVKTLLTEPSPTP